ncbi:MAG: hypothetical protein ACYTDV_19390, partial [Planctomycetota bacterium]
MSTLNNLGSKQASRREFLRTSSMLAVAALAAEHTASASALVTRAKLPQIILGKYSLSRLICGTNPF